MTRKARASVAFLAIPRAPARGRQRFAAGMLPFYLGHSARHPSPNGAQLSA